MAIKFFIDNEGKTSLATTLAMVLLILFIIFLLQNSANVDISFLFWRLSMARAVFLLASLAIGVVVGFIAAWEIFGRKKR